MGPCIASPMSAILDQLRRARPLPGALPWPRGGSSLTALCEALYADPADPRGPQAWGRELGMSERTLARSFEAEVGMSLRSWQRRLRLFWLTKRDRSASRVYWIGSASS